MTLAFAALAVSGVIRQAGYLGLFAVVLLENLVPPIPSEVVLPFAGWEISQGHLAAVPAMLAATAGSVAGALILYEIARRRGRAAILATARFSRVTAHDLDRAEAHFQRHGAWLVLVGRCVPGVRSLISVPAGLTAMPLAQFAVLTAVGSAVWNAVLIGCGVVLGSQFHRVDAIVGPVSTAVVALLAVLVLVAVVLLRRRA